MKNNNLNLYFCLYFMYKRRPCASCRYQIKYEDKKTANTLNYEFIEEFKYPQCMLFKNNIVNKNNKIITGFEKSYECRNDNSKCGIFGLYFNDKYFNKKLK
jgi:hypothetical protein